MIKKVLVLTVLAMAFFITACDDSSSGNTATFVFTGTSAIAGDIDGKTIYVKFAIGDCGADSDFLESTDFVKVDASRISTEPDPYTASATVTLNNVPSGTYKACGLIDMDGSSAAEESPTPSDGDITGEKEIIIPDDTETPHIVDIDTWIE